MATSLKNTTLDRFMGLNNVTDPLRLPFGFLSQADNIDITNTGAIVRRAGYTLDTAGTISGAYGTIDHQRMYYVDGGVLKAKGGPSLSTGLSTDPMYWTEVNQQVFFNNGVDSGIILPDNTVLNWSWQAPGAPTLRALTGSLPPGKYEVCCTYKFADGRETGSGDTSSIELNGDQSLEISNIPQASGMTTLVYLTPANSTVPQLMSSGAPAAIIWNLSPNALGRDLVTGDLDPLPSGATVIQHWKGRIYAAEHFPTESMTGIWRSQPLGFHLFDLVTDFIAVPGKVLAQIPTKDALIIGTDKAIHSFDGDSLTTLADYGVVPGWCWAVDDEDDNTYIWTVRGLCRAKPFKNLTEDNVSVDPGVQAGAAVVASGGQKRFVVSLHEGGAAFNERV